MSAPHPSLKSFVVEPHPLRPADRWVHWIANHVFRKLPTRLIRLLVGVDAFLSYMPFWMTFAYRRWSGVQLNGAEARKMFGERP